MTSKVADILRAFAYGDRQSVAEVAKLANLPQTTAYRLLKELERGEILERSAGGMYQPGRQLRLIGVAASPRLAISRHAAQVLNDLASATDAEPTLAVLDRLEVVTLQVRPYPRLAPTAPGSGSVPAHATAVGKVLLAFAASAVVNAVLSQKLAQFTPCTITDPAELRRAFSVARASMVAVARRELDMDTVGLATPVFDADGSVVAALGLQRVERPGDIEDLKPPLMVAARKLSGMLRLSDHPYPHVIALPDRPRTESAAPPVPARILRL
ncbi:MAG: IclR family transcriptional regulator [Pseudonocardia sp.]